MNNIQRRVTRYMDYISGLPKWLSLAKMPSATKMARFFSPLREQVPGARQKVALRGAS
jgi:hypothetical protein